MGKKFKKIHTINKYPNDLEAFFDRFVENFKFTEEFQIRDGNSKISAGTQAYTEVGPREYLSTTFRFGVSKIGVKFEVSENNTLDIFIKAGSLVRISLTTYVIDNVNKALKVDTPITDVQTPQSSSKQFCGECGAKIALGVKFCEGCGTKLKTS